MIIPLLPFEDKVKRRKGYKLRDANGNADAKDRGEIEVAIRWRFNVELEGRAKKSGSLFSKLGKQESDSEIDDDEDDAVGREAELT